jgi:hypothetical protein
MAAVLYLDVDDEITSAASRIRSGDASRVALVVPYGSRLATSRINFRLLAREAQARGRRLSIVAGDAATRALAASAGLPVFASVNEYEDAESGSPRAGGAPTAPAAPPPAEADETDGAGPPEAHASIAPPGRGAGRPTADEDATVMMAAPAAAAGRTRAIPVVGRRSAWPFGRTAGIIAVAAIALVLLVVGVAAFVLLPSAEITLTTRMERIGPVPLEIRADPDVTAVDPAAGVVPARRLTFDVAVDDTFATTGKRVAATKATGRVTFRSKNPTTENRIAAGSVVATPNGIRFRTNVAVVIPRATIIGLTIVPGEASVAITAVADGPEGNVEANAITVIPGNEDPTFTEVRNTQPTAGGTHEEFPQVSQADVDQARATLQERLGEEFDAILADPNRTPAGLELFPATKQLADATPTVDPAGLVGQEVTEFTLGLAATGTVIAVDEAPVEQLARQRISSSIDPGFELVDGSIEVEPGDPIVDGERVVFPVSVRGMETRILDLDALKEQLKGRPIAQARTILDEYGQADIRVWPDWVTAVPTLDDRITIRVQAPGSPAASPSPASSPR